MRLIRKIADFLLITYLFIASASACLVLVTYFLLDGRLKFTALTALVFFSTILIYNFHKVSSLFSEIPFTLTAIVRQLKSFPGLSLTMKGIALIGIAVSIWFVRPATLLALIPLTVITFAYSIPVLKVNGRK